MFIAVHQLDVLPNVAKRSLVISGLWNMKDIYLVWSCSETICISKYLRFLHGYHGKRASKLGVLRRAGLYYLLE